MTTHISKAMIDDGAIDANKLDASAAAAILTKLGLTDLLASLDARLDTLEGTPAQAASSLDVGDYCWSARATKSKWLLCDGAAISRTTYSGLFAVLGTRYGAGDGSTTFNLPSSAGRALVAAGTGTVAETFAATAVNITTGVITVASNTEKWFTGRKVRITTTTTLPGGLAANTDYFVIRDSATTIRLASSIANAVAGTAINITSQGSGTHTITHSFTARALGDLGGEEAHALTVAEMPSHTHTFTAIQSTGGSQWMQNDSSYGAVSTTTDATGGSGAHNIMQPYQVENLFIYTGV